MQIDISYEDDDLLVVNKPSGLLCVPGLSEPDNLHDRVLSYHANARVVHRLDMATSGLVIFALHHESQKRLGRMFENKEISKKYVAVVAGRVDADQGEINSPLICDWEKRPKQMIDWHSGKHSHTSYEVLDRSSKSSRLSLSPITGRTHQLRLHMEQIGHPIMGDKLYFHEGVNDKASRLLLHACELKLAHPISKEHVHIKVDAEF